MPFVLDASTTASWFFPDEHHPVAQRAREILETASDKAVVPPIWWYEISNILIVNERRGRTTSDRSAAFLENLGKLPIDRDPDIPPLVELARRHNLTTYDAAYLALALRKRIPLATLDKALHSAAVSAGIVLLA